MSESELELRRSGRRRSQDYPPCYLGLRLLDAEQSTTNLVTQVMSFQLLNRYWGHPTPGDDAAHMLIKESLRGELKEKLLRLVAAWFPRSVDTEYGGFLCNFDYRWKSAGSQPKMLEYQARQTIAAARSGAHSSDLAGLREIATHGFRYLKDRMWDGNLGGWYRLLDRDGTPREASTKHGHGSSYAISACAACYELTKDPECLELGNRLLLG